MQYTECTFRRSFDDSISISDMIYRAMSAEGNRVRLSGHIFFYSSNDFSACIDLLRGSYRVQASLYEFISLRTILYKNPITGHPDIVRAASRVLSELSCRLHPVFPRTSNKKHPRALKIRVRRYISAPVSTQ